MTGSQVRQKFLDYFAARGHRVVRSSSLVPANDPTLLFTNAGMNQFKDVFLGLEKRDYTRAASSQKCARAGGKHNDLENVGYTLRHHTFFEMLGNFSFGRSFKADAIDFAWTLLTKDYGLPKDKLYTTVFREDDEAEELRQMRAADPQIDTALRINADHARATTFLIHDGVLPSNDGRGYVLRKIMRRAMRHARMAGVEDTYLYQLTGFVAEWMRPAYPELMETVQRVARIVKDEEHRYATTFLVAEKVFNDEVKSLAAAVLPGPVAFKLYDTYGLALDEQEEMARERGLTIDREGFTAEMERQRTRARASWRGGDKGQIAAVYKDLPLTEFIGRETLEALVRVARVIQQDDR